MQSAALCYALRDASFANEVAGFLELNCPVAIFDKEGLLGPEEDLIDAAERALSSDFLLILLSPASVPNSWLRARWERVLVDEARNFGTQVAYLLLRGCKFPEVFRRTLFFDLSANRLAGQRALKRWMLHQDPFFETAVELPKNAAMIAPPAADLDDLERRLADRPGLQADVPNELASAFAHASASDFEGSFWVSCANRSRAGIIGDTAELLHLKLRGTLEQNARALHEFCASRRLLFVFQNIAPSDRELVIFGGKTSIIFVLEQTNPTRRSLEETAVLFSHWATTMGACLSALGDAQHHVGKLREYSPEHRATAILLGRAASSCLRRAGRLSEACELLESMIDALRSGGDPLTAAQLEWEKSWILDEWECRLQRARCPSNRVIRPN